MILWSLFMLWMILIQNIDGTVTQVPSHACVGEQVTVECSLTVPDPNSNFRTNFIDFIVGSSNVSLSDAQVNSETGVHGGVDLSRLTAFANNSFSGDKIIRGSITLSSYTASDAGIRLGCSGVYFLSGTSGATDIFRQTTRLISAAPPPAPSMLSISSSNIDPNTCSATISLNWIPPSSTDRPITSYYLSLQNRTRLESISAPANSYSHNTNIILGRICTYSVSASSCAGDSNRSSSLMMRYSGYILSLPISLSCLRHNDASLITMHWGLNALPYRLLLQYSMTINIVYTQGSSSISFRQLSTFTLLSFVTSYTQSITPHNFSTTDRIDTNITACLKITHQCGQPYSSTTEICRPYTSILIPPTTSPIHTATSPIHTATTPIHTAASNTTTFPNTTTTSASSTSTSSQGVITSVLFSILFLIALIVIAVLIVLIILFIRRKKRSKTFSKPAQSDYEYIDLDTLSGSISSPIPQQQYHDYASTSPEHRQERPQPSTEYANLK